MEHCAGGSLSLRLRDKQHQEFVFGGVHVGAQLVGSRPQCFLYVVEHALKTFRLAKGSIF